jgi:hypothetical protein
MSGLTSGKVAIVLIELFPMLFILCSVFWTYLSGLHDDLPAGGLPNRPTICTVRFLFIEKGMISINLCLLPFSVMSCIGSGLLQLSKPQCLLDIL